MSTIKMKYLLLQEVQEALHLMVLQLVLEEDQKVALLIQMDGLVQVQHLLRFMVELKKRDMLSVKDKAEYRKVVVDYLDQKVLVAEVVAGMAEEHIQVRVQEVAVRVLVAQGIQEESQMVQLKAEWFLLEI